MEKWVPHIWKEGARFHVISYHFTSNGLVMKCSERNCEMNKKWIKAEGDRTTESA